MSNPKVRKGIVVKDQGFVPITHPKRSQLLMLQKERRYLVSPEVWAGRNEAGNLLSRSRVLDAPGKRP